LLGRSSLPNLRGISCATKYKGVNTYRVYRGPAVEFRLGLVSYGIFKDTQKTGYHIRGSQKV